MRVVDRLGFVARPDCDVSYHEWGRPTIPDLPPEWIGEPFLAYRFTP